MRENLNQSSLKKCQKIASNSNWHDIPEDDKKKMRENFAQQIRDLI